MIKKIFKFYEYENLFILYAYFLSKQKLEIKVKYI